MSARIRGTARNRQRMVTEMSSDDSFGSRLNYRSLTPAVIYDVVLNTLPDVLNLQTSKFQVYAI